jgi:translation initiation factor 3 subunit L
LKQYFEKSAWPSPEAVSGECGGDELFLSLYKELTLRHLHSIARPSPKDRVEGWHVYCALFDSILKNASEAESSPEKIIYLLPEWIFDVLHEFVYQFQGFCQFRTSTFTNAAKYGPNGANEGKATPNHIVDAIDVLSNNRDAWAVQKVISYLHQFQTIRVKAPLFGYLSLFSSVGKSRLECLLGDYTASLNALGNINSNSIIDPPRCGDDDVRPMTAVEVVDSVFAAKLSVAYHQGVCYLMLRRYRDACRVLGDICTTMLRGFKSGEYKNTPGSDQFNKLYDRMIALLAIITHVCPENGLVDASLARGIRDKHGKQLSKIESGEEGYEDLFIFACPKFVTPSVPRYELALTEGACAGPHGQDAYKLQVKHFMSEMANQQTMRKLRSYMKLYTSISVEKLGRLVMEEDFVSLLVSYKHKMHQIECKDSEESGTTTEAAGTVMDIHYYIIDDMIHLEDAEKLHRFENYFMSQISQSTEIKGYIDDLSVKV